MPNWYASSTGDSLLQSNAETYVTGNISTSSTYYVSFLNTETGCASSRIPVLAQIHAKPAQPFGSDGIRCGIGSILLSASTTSANTIDWYTTLTGDVLVKTSDTLFNTPTLSATTTYFAATRNLITGCVSASRTAVVASVFNAVLPFAPIGNSASRCGFGSINISAQAIPGTTIDWFSSPIGGFPILSGSNNYIALNLSNTTTYYAQARDTNTGCFSASRTAVVAIIKQISSSITNKSVCANLLPYTWNGLSFSAAEIYSTTLINAAGCDSIANLNLTEAFVNNNSKLFVSANTVTIGNVVTFSAYDSIYTINIPASKDNSIYMDASNNSNGVGTSLFVGNNGTNSPRRSLIKFDLTTIPAGSAIKNVNLKLNCNTSGSLGIVSIYKLLTNWGEGTSNATASGGGGGGVMSTLNDATWNCNLANGAGGCNSLWLNPGGDYYITPSASTAVSASNINYNWTDVNMLPTVQSWVNNSSENFGWMIKGAEDAAGTAKRFGSRENADFSQRPLLTVNYLETGLNYTFIVNGVTVQSGPLNVFSSSALHNGDVVFCSITKNNNSCASITNSVLMNIIDTTRATLNVKAYLQGSYLGSGLMRSTLHDLEISRDATATDSVEINLWSISSLSNPTPDFTSKAILHNNGIATVVFPEYTLGKSYYVAIKHRNSVETWSASPILLNFMTNYDFTNNLNSAYGDGVNPTMKQANDGKLLLYSGDTNKDGAIDISDMQITVNDASNFLFGYNSSDCNGDGGTDISDMQLIENNAGLFIFYARP
jgi:hypothetical protein